MEYLQLAAAIVHVGIALRLAEYVDALIGGTPQALAVVLLLHIPAVDENGNGIQYPIRIRTAPASQLLQRVAGIDDDILRYLAAQQRNQPVQLLRLIEGLAAGNGDAIHLSGHPGDHLHDPGRFQLIAGHGVLQLRRHTPGAAEAASGDPDPHPGSGAQHPDRITNMFDSHGYIVNSDVILKCRQLFLPQ